MSRRDEFNECVSDDHEELKGRATSKLRRVPGYFADSVPGERGWPRGPTGSYESPHPVAIGFCTWCGTNARRTCSVRGFFDCPECVHVWYDSRVGEQTLSFEDFFGPRVGVCSVCEDNPALPGISKCVDCVNDALPGGDGSGGEA